MAVPQSAAAVFYAYTISSNNVEVGMIQNFSPSSTRTVERIRQIFYNTGARVVDMVWGGTDTTVEVEMMTLYKKNTFEAWGFQIMALEDLMQKVDIVEEMTHPDGVTDRLVYHQCGWERWGQTRNTNTAHVAATCSIAVSWVSGVKGV